MKYEVWYCPLDNSYCMVPGDSTPAQYAFLTQDSQQIKEFTAANPWLAAQEYELTINAHIAENLVPRVKRKLANPK